MKPIRLLLLFLSFCPLAVYAQTAEVGGAVQDPSGAVIPKASVEFRNQDTGVRRQTSTNSDGLYHIVGLDPGKYDATVQASGFKTLTRENIVFQVGDKSQIDFRMQVGQSSQSITVDGSGQQINTTDASVSTVIDRQFVANIPLNGRSFQSLETLAPGVSLVPVKNIGTGYSGEIAVNGQRTEANYFTVDGVSANTGVNATSSGSGGGYSGSVPGESALGTTQSLVSIDALQEFRATTSTYSAEYGRSPGGQFSFVTRAGTDQFHGLLFDYFRNDALDAANWFDGYTNNPPLRKAAERQNDFGGTLGGPLRVPLIYNAKRPTFFFFSYEGLRLDAPQTAALAQYPSSSARSTAPSALQPFLNAYPTPNGPDLGNGFATYSSSYSNPASLDSFGIRIDHTFSDKLSIFGRYSHAPSSAGVRQTQDLANIVNSIQNVDAITLGVTELLSQRMSNQLRFNYTDNDGEELSYLDSFGGAQPVSASIFNLSKYSLTELAFGNSSFALGPESAQQKQFNVVDTFSEQLRRHAISLGLDYRRLSTHSQPFALEQIVIFDTLNQIQNNTASLAELITQPIPTEPVYTNLSAFIQDEWKATHRLNFSLGVRWELNPPPGDGYGNIPYTLNEISDLATASLAPKGTRLWRTTYANFAPRVGIAYVANSRLGWETVIRAGGGTFFDPGNELATQGVAGIGYSQLALYFGIPFPLTSSQLAVPPPSIAAPYSGSVFAYDPHLKSPYATEWNLAIEQSLGKDQNVVVNYVGSAGRKMLLAYETYPSSIGNMNFSASGAAYVTANRANSSYNSLQVKYQRQLSHGLQALISYTWSHSIDDASSNFTSFDIVRGNSDFDIRHDFQGAVTYNIPLTATGSVVRSAFSNWSVDGRFTSRTGLPVDITGTSYVTAPNGTREYLRADLIPGQPLYVYGSQYPGGRIFNFSAFSTPTAAEIAAGDSGNAPRNLLRGFSAVQLDSALQRRFQLGENFNLQFRAEAFNLFNHPNFGAIQHGLSAGSKVGGFGYATNTLNSQLGGLNPLYQTGGPRSMQLALRLQF